MAIGFRASSSADISAATATVTPTLPAGTASTDAVVFVFGTDNGNSVTTTVTPPAGVTRIGLTVLGSTASNRIKLDAFVCLGSQAALGFTNSSSGATIQQGWVAASFTGVDNVNPIDVADTSGTNTGTGAATLTVNGVTVATNQAWDCIACCDWNSGVFSGTGFTVVENGHTQASAGLLYNQTPKSTGPTGTATLGDSGSATGQIINAIRFALRPAAGGAAAPVAKVISFNQAVRRASFF